MNADTGLRKVSGIYLTKNAAATGNLSFNETVQVQINVTKTGADTSGNVSGIDTHEMNSGDGNVTVASGAQLGISVTSNMSSLTIPLWCKGAVSLNGDVGIVGRYTGAGTISPSNWQTTNVGSGTIGNAASISIDMPGGIAHGMSSFEVEAAENTKVSSLSWDTIPGSRSFDNDTCRIVESDVKTPYYADFAYMKKSGATAVTGISASVDNATLATGATTTASAVVNPDGATYKGVLWSSSNSNVATVDADGKVTAGMTAGKTVLTATSKFDASIAGSCIVTVGSLDGNTIYQVAATITAPVVGQSPATTATFGPNFELYNITWEYWNGTNWVNNSGAAFDASKLYRVDINIKETDADKSYAAANLMVATVNGNPTAVNSIYGSGGVIASVHYTFGAPAAGSADTTPPTLSAPGKSDVTATGAKLNFTSNEAGTYYYVVYTAAATPPTKDIVAAHNTGDANGTGAAATGSNSTNLVSGLTPSTAYIAYVVVKDAANNISDVATISFSTAALSGAKAITAYSLAGVSGTITESGHTIAVTVPYTTNVTSLAATFTLSPGATAKVGSTPQTSGATANDFTNPVTYTITAEDSTTQNYTVTVTKAKPKLLSVTAPSAKTLTGTYTTADAVLTSGELPDTVVITAEDGATTLACTWTFPTGAYSAAAGAANTFHWDATTTTYDVNEKTVSGNVVIRNKGALGGTVSITGTEEYGSELAANISALTGNSGVLSYQWKRGTTEIGTNSDTYELVADDIGQTITVEVTSSAEPGTITSAPTGTIGRKHLTDVAIGAIGNQTYTGSQIQPVPVVTSSQTVGGYTLLMDTDYTVSYGTNTALGTTNNYVKITSTGTGCYSFSEVTKPFGIDYAITLDANGGSVSSPPAVTGTDGKLTSLPTPTRSSYSFAGWYTLANGGIAVTTSTVFTGNDTIYAHWTYTGGSGSGGSGGGSVSTNYKVTDGDHGKWTEESDGGLTVTINAPYSKLNKVLVDGATVATTNYTAKSGSTIITLKPAYLETLSLGKHTLRVNFTDGYATADFTVIAPEVVNPFTDVADSDYYYDSVLWAVKEGITEGTSATTFSPADSCTRAQMATFLWRAAGSPAAKATVNPFDDVMPGAYYYDAVMWAVEKGITQGTGATTFSPDATCTRGQMATFLYRFSKSPAVTGVNPFDDVNDTDYYCDPIRWAYENDITEGTSATTFSPKADCTRGQIVTFLYRLLGE